MKGICPARPYEGGACKRPYWRRLQAALVGPSGMLININIDINIKINNNHSAPIEERLQASLLKRRLQAAPISAACKRRQCAACKRR